MASVDADPHRWRPYNRWLVVAGVALLVALGAGTRWVIADATTVSPTTRSELCSEHELLISRLASGDVFATQAINHSARRLSQLADRYDQNARPASRASADGVSVAQAGSDIRTVLGSVAWETPDIVTATRPIALECGWTWPVTATPPAPSPRPPSS